MKKKFRWAYIGSGSICEITADQIVKGDHEIATVYSRRFESAEEFAARYGAAPCRTFEEAVDRDDIDGVYIGTPHTSHKDYAIRGLRMKKPVLCEKPIGINTAEVEEMIAVSREEGVYLAEAMWTWYAPVAHEVRKWVQEGRIGALKSAYGSFCIPGLSTKPRENRLLNPATAGGALLDLCVYPITYFYNLYGMPQEIQCDGELANGIDEEEKVVLRYPAGECTCVSSLRYQEEKFSIIGEKGTIIIPGEFHGASIAECRCGSQTFTAEGVTDYANEFTKVAEEILEGRQESAYVPLRHTLDCMKIMDECRRQLGLTYPADT